MDELTKRVLGSFEHWRKDSLDLHVLFEAGGNDPDARTRVFDRSPRREVPQLAGSSPPLLDAKGRVMPPDVKSMMANMKRSTEKPLKTAPE